MRGGSEPTRREVLGAGLTLAAGGVLGAVAGGGATASAAVAGESDAQLLAALVGAQLLGVFTYQTVLATGLMSPGHEVAATKLLDQVRHDLHVFEGRLVGLGGTPPAPFATVSEADTVLLARGIPNSLANLPSERDCLTVLVRVEDLMTGAYFKPIAKLSDLSLVSLCMAAMGSSAQHFSYLNELLHPGDLQKAVPGPFVYGAYF